VEDPWPDTYSEPRRAVSRAWTSQFTFTGHTDKVYAAKFTGDSSHVVRAVLMLSRPHGYPGRSQRGCCSPPGNSPQISGSQDRWIKVWDLEKNYCKGDKSAEVEGRLLLTIVTSASRWALGDRSP